MSQRRAGGGRGAGGAPGGAPGGGAPTNAGARGALLLAAAVILGIVLLQKFDSGTFNTGGQISTGTSVPLATTTTRKVGLTTVPVVTTTTVKARAKADVKVVVANGAGVKNLATTITATLKTAGYATGIPTDATVPTVDKTTVQFVDGYDAEAREVALTLGLPVTTATKLNAPPVAAADIADAKVVVVAGVDFPTGTPTSSTLAGVTTSTTRKP
ncbi:MAG TPA: LytR C-terminal domain-containing protein [Acidimicrobiales bacterium]|jgi:hypothetical protein|nr:LytR C-terminal domain-containing protein [Acidimicrobiales bacterium]